MTLEKLMSEAYAIWRENAPEGRKLFDEILLAYPDKRLEILRERASGYSLDRAYDLAFFDRKLVADSNISRIGDLFMAGMSGVRAELIDQGVFYLERCISSCLIENDNYYISSAQILAAFCHARLGNKKRALVLLDYLDDDVSLPWWHGSYREINKRVVLGELQR